MTMTNDGTLKIEKVTPIESKQPQPAAKFTVGASLEGFPVQVEVEGKADDLRALVARLKAIGATPPVQTPAPRQASTPAASSEDAPICEYHGAMKPSKFGGWFCSKKMGDGSHCKSKA